MKNFHLEQKNSRFSQLMKLNTKVNINFFNINNTYFRLMKLDLNQKKKKFS